MFYDGLATGSIEYKGHLIPLKILEEAMKVNRTWSDNLYNVVLSYLLLDFEDYQEYLTTKSTITLTLSECFARHYLSVFSQAALNDCTEFRSCLTSKVLEALSDDNCSDYSNFLTFICFLDKIYTYHFNGAFLRSLSRAIFTIVLTPLFQNQILKSPNPVVSEAAMQYLTLILENITSQKFAQCIFYFLFGVGDIFNTESPKLIMSRQGLTVDVPIIRARARSEIVENPRENFSFNVINASVSLEDFNIGESSTNTIIEHKKEFCFTVNYNELFKRKHRPNELAAHIFNLLRSNPGSLIAWQLINRLMKFQLPTFLQYTIIDHLRANGEVRFGIVVGSNKT